MSGQVYSVEFEGVAISAAQDLFELTPADDRPVELVGLFLGQVSDLGDAQEEAIAIKVIRGHATGGSGGSTGTVNPVKKRSASAGATAEVNNTTIASTGSPLDLHSDVWYLRAGYGLWWPEGAEPDADQADTTIVVRLVDAPADAITATGTLYFREK